jgi:hypothetical protein
MAVQDMYKIWKDGQPLSHKTTIYRLSIIFATLALVLHQAYESSKQYKGNFGEEINPLIICTIICTFYLVMLLVTLRKTGWFAKHNWTTIGAPDIEHNIEHRRPENQKVYKQHQKPLQEWKAERG